MTGSSFDRLSPRIQTGVMAITLLLIAINLRPVIASVGPLVEEIHAATGMASIGIGWLSTLPLLLMGFAAFSVRPLREKLGESRGISIGILLILMACTARGVVPDSWVLYVSAGIAGVGIAVIQALAPGYIKAHFKQSASRMIGLYSTGIVGGAAVAAGVSADVSEWLGWPGALGIWSMPAGIALVLWLMVAGSAKPSVGAATSSPYPFYADARSWSLLVFFGVGTSAFMLILAWLPPYFMDLGMSADASGYRVAGFTLIELMAALLVSTWIHRFPDRRGLLLLALMLIVSGLLVVVYRPLEWSMLAVALLGVGIGIHFPLSLIVTAEHCDNPARAGEMMAFVQGGGYVIAATAPLGAGWLRDLSGHIALVWLVMAVLIALLVFLVVRYSPSSYRVFRTKLAQRTAE